jgi:hypothetical protein
MFINLILTTWCEDLVGPLTLRVPKGKTMTDGAFNSPTIQLQRDQRGKIWLDNPITSFIALILLGLLIVRILYKHVRL